MGIKRIVDTSFWTDGKVDEFSPEDKYFMLYLLTNPFSTQLGIYEISIKHVAFQLGYSDDSVRVLIDRFENKYGIILYSPQTNEIAIKNFLRHSIVKGGKPVKDCIEKEMKKVKNKDLIRNVFGFLTTKDGLNVTVNEIITEYKNVNDNQNDNDNDNERIVHESSTNRPSAQQIVDLFNSICVSFPSVRSLSDARKKAIKARLNTYTVEQFKTMFEMAEASPFLKGQNNRNWQANFDWLIKDSNFAKVLDGNYSDKKTYGANGVAIDQSKTDLDDLF